jgi:hypothetical protein
MSVFKRRKKEQLDTDPTDDDVDAVTQDDSTDEGEGESGFSTTPPTLAPERPQGPWDSADAPPRDLPRLDLGALLVPVAEGLEVRVDVNAERQVVAATLVKGQSALQLSAFAAPRTDGIWDEVRDEIAAALAQGGGSAEPADGPFGTELRAAVPTKVPDRGVVLAPARFLGVDGPRWFVRGLVTGAAAADPAQAGELEQAFRDVVVVRGDEAMAVRDPLPLRLPPEAQEATPGGSGTVAAAQDGQPAAEGGPDGGAATEGARDPLRLPEPGPEITETR